MPNFDKRDAFHETGKLISEANAKNHRNEVVEVNV